MANLPNITLELSDKTQVLQAALHLPTFTLVQLADATGLKIQIVQAILGRSKDMLEEVSILGENGSREAARPSRYRLRESARARVAREAVELSERVHGAQRAPMQDVARAASVALDAVESSIALGSDPDADKGSWERRAHEQLDLARRLLVLVKDQVHRSPLQRRLVQLAGQLEVSAHGMGENSPEFGPPRTQAPALSPPSPPSIGPNGKIARTVWKYPNRRLYDALDRRYITLIDVHKFVTSGTDFVVIEKRSRADITRSILLQIVAEKEQSGGSESSTSLMSKDFLSEIIRSCDGVPRCMVGAYLEQSLEVFTQEASKSVE
jgi:polyhydroxyalkanoate synthesis repressor PhaR